MKLRLIVGAVLLVVASTGCPPFEMVSWSPNGRYLAFIGPDDDRLWLWDTREGQAIAKNWEVDTNIVLCQFMTNDELLVFRKRDGSDTYDAYKRNIRKETWKELVRDAKIERYAVSEDGRYLYYIKKTEQAEGTRDSGDQPAKEQYVLLEIDLSRPEREKVVVAREKEFSCPDVDPLRSKFVFAGEAEEDVGGIFMYERTSGETRHLPGEKGDRFYWPRWVNDQVVVSMREREGENNDQEGFTTLVLHDFATKSTQELCRFVWLFDPPSLNGTRDHVVATALVKDLSEVGEELSAIQVIEVDLKTGEKRVLTDEPFGAGRAAYDLAGKRVAYVTPAEPEKASTIRILDIDTGKKTVVWRDAEEKMLADAERLAAEGDFQGALQAFGELLEEFPKTRLEKVAQYHILMLRLRPPVFDLDKAFAQLRHIDSTDIRQEERALLWRDPDRIATDPAGDWIRTYGTEAAAKEFGFNTDDARDLLALWARWSPERLYLRLDFNSARDLEGLTFQDTLILFDCDSPDAGFRQISPLTQWDRGAERQVLIRHWFDGGDRSQYDVEIRDGSGEVWSRFVASGFPQPNYPHFAVHRIGDWPDAPGSVFFSLSRQALGLEGEKKVFVQVCTFKGGIEEHKKLERSREQPGDKGAVCDVADAFGPENTAERIARDAETAQKGHATIKGCAAILEIDADQPPETVGEQEETTFPNQTANPSG